MLEHKHKGVLSLNLKKLASCFDDFKMILILQNEILLLIIFCKRVLKQREDIPRYGNTINNSFLGAVCSNTFYENYLFKNTLMHLSTYALIHEEVNYLKDVLKKNSIPTNLVDKCIKIFLNKQFSQKILEHTVPKK